MSDLGIRRLNFAAPDFFTVLDEALAWERISQSEVADQVSAIIAAVKARGDAALLDYTRRFDGWSPASVAELEVAAERVQQALASIAPAQREALRQAAARIRDYHARQLLSSWHYTDAAGNLLGQQVTALQRVGVYVPGGKAAYPSTVLMNVIPARVAGVDEIHMVVPASGGELNDLVLAAAAIAGVDRIFTLGGAQAVAALAYGTQTVPRVDKIVGPGNIYVATAKRQVFGQVGIDMIAGPSEVLVISDGSADPAWIAMDLFSQAEHDEDAQAILVSPDAAVLDAVAAQMALLLPSMERAEVIAASLARRAVFIQVADLEQAVQVVNHVAPEHLELALEDAAALVPRIRNAGAIFIGRYTPEAFGDYCAGPNHVLPTSGTARFSSPLGVYDFQKRSSIIECSPQGAHELGGIASVLARGEGLTAHARSAEYRLEQKPGK